MPGADGDAGAGGEMGECMESSWCPLWNPSKEPHNDYELWNFGNLETLDYTEILNVMSRITSTLR